MDRSITRSRRGITGGRESGRRSRRVPIIISIVVLIFGLTTVFAPAGFGAPDPDKDHGKSENAHADAPGQNKDAGADATAAVHSGGGNTHPNPPADEPGHSGTQGKSGSEPDDNGKGPERDTPHVDKPGGTGGSDNDRDGNNGCGNDTDRDDDNEGWCGKKAKPPKPPKPPTKPPKPPTPPEHPPRPHQPSASIAASCAVPGVVITLTNAGVNTEHFLVFKGGVRVDRVQVKGQSSAIRRYAMAEDETATWSVVADKGEIASKRVTNDCALIPPPPTTEVSSSASAAQGCNVGGVSGALVRLRNSGDVSVTFAIKKDGGLLALVTLGPGNSASRTFDLREDETATFTVAARGMTTLSSTLTNDCVAGTQFRQTTSGKTLPVTGVGFSAKAIAGGLLALAGAASLALAIRRRQKAETLG